MSDISFKGLTDVLKYKYTTSTFKLTGFSEYVMSVIKPAIYYAVDKLDKETEKFLKQEYSGVAKSVLSSGIGGNPVETFYEEYDPKVYDRNYSLYDAYEISGSMGTTEGMSLTPDASKLSGGSSAYDAVFIGKYHGGVYDENVGEWVYPNGTFAERASDIYGDFLNRDSKVSSKEITDLFIQYMKEYLSM